jgi:L-alanine-DL-glutamate epimerase-like enolase superfamily enzyme
MRLTELITIRRDDLPSLGWLQLVTDEGIIGLGETCLHLDAVEGYLHEVAAPRLLGEEPRDIERHARRLYDSFTGWGGSGAETKGNSAVDVALWDILGQSLGQPLYRLLGGRCRERIRTYNTCAGPWYGQVRAAEPIRNWNLPDDGVDLNAFEDLDAFLHRADELAESLLSDGLTAMKIWPFDRAAMAHDGLSISAEEMRGALEPIEKVRAAVGDRIDIMIELHALWKPGPAKAIARALEDYEPYWVEDAIKLDDMLAVSRFVDSTRLPCTFGETIGTRARYYELLERCDLGYLMLDLGWCGGLSEAKKVAAIAELHGVPIAPHDCTGPIGLTAGTHLAISTPNAVLQESVRAFYRGWYRDLVTELPTVVDGFIAPPDGPGLGTALQPDLLERPGTRVRRTGLEDL